jgi:hypothetical protein
MRISFIDALQARANWIDLLRIYYGCYWGNWASLLSILSFTPWWLSSMLIISIKPHLWVWQTAALFGLGLRPLLAKKLELLIQKRIRNGWKWYGSLLSIRGQYEGHQSKCPENWPRGDAGEIYRLESVS